MFLSWPSFEIIVYIEIVGNGLSRCDKSFDSGFDMILLLYFCLFLYFLIINKEPTSKIIPPNIPAKVEDNIVLKPMCDGDDDDGGLLLPVGTVSLLGPVPPVPSEPIVTVGGV